MHVFGKSENLQKKPGDFEYGEWTREQPSGDEKGIIERILL